MERHSNKTPCCCCGCRQMGRRWRRPWTPACNRHASERLPCTYTYVWTWLAVLQWTGMLAASIDGDITPMDMLCARRCTRRTLQGVSHGWVDRHAVAASCQALPFPCCLDDGSRRHASNAKNSSHPSHPTQPSTQPSDNDLRSHHTSRGCPVAETWCVQESMCSF